MSDLGAIVNDHIREMAIEAEHDNIREKLTGVESKLLTHNAMYQILENIRKERGFKKDTATAKHERQIDKLREKQRKLKKELFLFRLKHGLKHD